MATRNFVPRANGEGSIGTSAKKWASGFFQNLAVSAITTAVNVVVPAASANDAQPATTSWVRSQFQSILTGVLQAAGLRYNIASNGYICFGSLFGGLILQWGNILAETTQIDIQLPIAFTQTIFPCVSAKASLTTGNYAITISDSEALKQIKYMSDIATPVYINYIVLGR